MDTRLFKYRSCGYRPGSVQKLWIQGRFGTEAVDTGLVQYWICGFKAGSGSGTKTVKSTGPVDTNLAGDSVLVLYRRCGDVDIVPVHHTVLHM